MDLNAAMFVARSGYKVRDDATMKPDWAMTFVPTNAKQMTKPDVDSREGLFFYVNPQGEQAHKIMFTDAMRASFQWRTIP